MLQTDTFKWMPELKAAAKTLKVASSKIFYAFSQTEYDLGMEYRVPSTPSHSNAEIQDMFRSYNEAKLKHSELLIAYNNFKKQQEAQE